MSIGEAFTLRIQEEIIGILTFRIEKKYLHICDIQIRKDYQGKGLSKAIFYFLGRKVQDYNLLGMELSVYDDNPAKKLYERMGFEVIPKESEGSILLMRKEIDEHEVEK